MLVYIGAALPSSGRRRQLCFVPAVSLSLSLWRWEEESGAGVGGRGGVGVRERAFIEGDVSFSFLSPPLFFYLLSFVSVLSLGVCYACLMRERMAGLI